VTYLCDFELDRGSMCIDCSRSVGFHTRISASSHVSLHNVGFHGRGTDGFRTESGARVQAGPFPKLYWKDVLSVALLYISGEPWPKVIGIRPHELPESSIAEWGFHSVSPGSPPIAQSCVSCADRSMSLGIGLEEHDKWGGYGDREKSGRAQTSHSVGRYTFVMI
jgi:hypothetical protein